MTQFKFEVKVWGPSILKINEQAQVTETVTIENLKGQSIRDVFEGQVVIARKALAQRLPQIFDIDFEEMQSSLPDTLPEDKPKSKPKDKKK